MKRFAILGHPVAHSLSPKLHNAVFQSLGLNDHHYEALDVLPEQLADVLQKMRAGDYQGFSVTIPHKQTIIPLLDELSNTAKKVGAVNTVIRRDDGTLFGENTDYAGFRKSLEEAKVSSGKALVLGSGGAAQAVIAVLKDLGFQVTVTSRSERDGTVSYDQLNPEDDYAVIVNTTPVGMSPNVDQSPLTDPSWFRKDRTYVDVIYNPKMTKFLQMAEQAGANIITGDRMFLWQAVEQAKMFTGRDEIPSPHLFMKV
jgi:shikimate dehydrogenase